MDAPNYAVHIIESMQSNGIKNYIAPGLNSFLIGDTVGKVRMFHQTLPQEFYISPHNHRFDFCCYVLAGQVTNHYYKPTYRANFGHKYRVGTYHLGTPTHPWHLSDFKDEWFMRHDRKYITGEWYGMEANDFHSITFSLGARVLFFEGPMIRDVSQCLQPYSDDEVIPLFTVHDWMYKK